MIIERRAAIMLVGDDVGDAPRDIVFLFSGGEDRVGRRGVPRPAASWRRLIGRQDRLRPRRLLCRLSIANEWP